MPETEHFINEGYGWACRRCREADDVTKTIPVADSSSNASALPRFFREGEAEEREPRLSENALARWKDDSHHTLLCTRCGVEEDINE